VPTRIHRSRPVSDQTRLSHLFTHVPDLKAMRRFYVEQLGLEVLMEEAGYLRVGGGGGFNIGMEELSAGMRSEGLEINVEVPDVDLLHERLAAEGVSFLAPPADMPWGVRECWLNDPSGVLVGLFTPSRR